MQLILKYSKSFSCLQILSVFASRGLCIAAKQASVQQDICYIFLDGLLTLEQKKNEDCACHVQGEICFTNLDFFEGMFLFFSVFLVALSCRLCSPSAAQRAALPQRRAQGHPHESFATGLKAAPSSLLLRLALESVQMCCSKHPELEQTPALLFFCGSYSWSSQRCTDEPSDSELCLVGRRVGQNQMPQLKEQGDGIELSCHVLVALQR